MARSSKPSLQARLARWTKRERLRREWTQEQTAEKAGLNIRHYQKLEEGSVNATLQTLEQLCDAFGVEVEELFGR